MLYGWSCVCLLLCLGILTMYCEHGVCLGFQLMPENESPRHVFEMLYDRYIILLSNTSLHRIGITIYNLFFVLFYLYCYFVPRFTVAPKVVYYDRGCQ